MTNVVQACRHFSAALSAPRSGSAADIRGYHADLDAGSLGYSVNVFAFVGRQPGETDLQEFEAGAHGAGSRMSHADRPISC